MSPHHKLEEQSVSKESENYEWFDSILSNYDQAQNPHLAEALPILLESIESLMEQYVRYKKWKDSLRKLRLETIYGQLKKLKEELEKHLSDLDELNTKWGELEQKRNEFMDAWDNSIDDRSYGVPLGLATEDLTEIPLELHPKRNVLAYVKDLLKKNL